MSRYENTSVKRKSLLPRKKNNVLAYDTTIYSEIPQSNNDMHIISTEGDRCDLLAHRFYKDESMWWFIARANNLTSMNIPAGTKLRIPSSTSSGTTK